MNQFKYLGVNVTEVFDKLFKENFINLLQRITQDLQSWRHVMFSLAGRINIVKMNILPKFVFLFQCIPIYIKKSFFHDIDKIISAFIWNNKTPRIRKLFLQRLKSVGGMGLPDIKLYYWACNIRMAAYWLQKHPPTWVKMEAHSCLPSSPSALLLSPLSRGSLGHLQNPVVIHTLKIWSQIRKNYGWQAGSLLSPLTHNHCFAPSFNNSMFDNWVDRGIHTFMDLFMDKTFPSFAQLQDKFDMPNSHFFKYLQVRTFVKSSNSLYPSSPDESLMETILLYSPQSKGAIAKVYAKLSECSETVSSTRLRMAWQDDLNMEISEEQWRSALGQTHKISTCARHGLIQFKILHRLHWSKQRLHRIYPTIDPSCDRCGLTPTSLGHMFWTCPKLTNYWNTLSHTLSDVLRRPIQLEPLVAVLGVVDTQKIQRRTEKYAISFVCLMARRLILLNWKQKMAPSHLQLKHEILKYLDLEKIRLSLQNQEEQFDETWKPFMDYFKAGR